MRGCDIDFIRVEHPSCYEAHQCQVGYPIKHILTLKPRAVPRPAPASFLCLRNLGSDATLKTREAGVEAILGMVVFEWVGVTILSELVR